MITVKNISKEFISAKKYPGLKGAVKGLFSREKVRKTAVDNISFDIADGEIVGYIGSNGAGKSTTIKMMTGILKPTGGTCLINGIDPSRDRNGNAASIGVVFGQRTQLWWDLPLSESYTILKEIYNVSDEDYEQRMKFLNDVLGLQEFFTQSVRTLSLGQRMRADLGASLLHNPKVLYLDEPTIGLDLVVKDKIREAIREINEKYNTTVILTTHDIGDIEELCSRIIVIDEGHKIYDGGLKELKELYGKRRRVSMEVENMSLCRERIRDELSGLNGNDFTIESDEERNLMIFSFNRDEVQISEIISAVMRITEIRDVEIKDTELSEIVKEIYNHNITALEKGE